MLISIILPTEKRFEIGLGFFFQFVGYFESRLRETTTMKIEKRVK